MRFKMRLEREVLLRKQFTFWECKKCTLYDFEGNKLSGSYVLMNLNVCKDASQLDHINIALREVFLKCTLYTHLKRERECVTAKQRDSLRLCREMHTLAFQDLNSQLCRGQQDKDEEKRKREKGENRIEKTEMKR